MAYGTKYKFKFQNVNGAVYEIRLQEMNYSGTATERPLGAAPVIHMQENGAIRSTSVDLTLECQVDGEFAFLYTSDPQKYRIAIYTNTDLIWQGFVATELYSEPDIAPPYDVKVTATDGLGALKEYEFEPVGSLSIRRHLENLMLYTGLDLGFRVVTSLEEYSTAGNYPLDTPNAFIDGALINLDFYEGKTVYDVLEGLLSSLRCTITQWNDDWLIIRETDLSVNGNGRVPGYYIPTTRTTATYSTNINYLTATVGQMGVANMWPIGFLTRRIVPAKYSVKVRSPWTFKNGFQKVSDNTWTLSGNVSFNNAGYLLYLQPASGVTIGTASQSKVLNKLVTGIRVRIKAEATSMTTGSHYVTLQVTWGNYRYSPSTGWAANPNLEVGTETITATSETHDPDEAQVVEFVIPSILDTNIGTLSVSVSGFYVIVHDIEVMPDTVAGYEDNILIDNDARGERSPLDSAFGTINNANYESLDFLMGVFWRVTDLGGATMTSPIYYFSDSNNTNKDYLAITALSCAKECAAPRIEITGTIDVPNNRNQQPLLIKSHNVWALMESYDWNLKEAEINFKAVTLPTASLTVDSETRKSIPNQ